jgi:hypothetical protein
VHGAVDVPAVPSRCRTNSGWRRAERLILLGDKRRLSGSGTQKAPARCFPFAGIVRIRWLEVAFGSFNRLASQSLDSLVRLAGYFYDARTPRLSTGTKVPNPEISAGGTRPCPGSNNRLGRECVRRTV